MLTELLFLLALADSESLTLKQAVELALANNPEVRIAQAQEEKARQAVREARSPFIPNLVLGSGLAATSGFPLSIEGSAPSVINVVGSGLILNIPQRHLIRETQALARAGTSGAASRRDDVAWRTAATYLELDKAARALEVARREADSLKKLEQLTNERVQAGLEIPLELTRARLAAAKNRQRTVDLEGQVTLQEATLKALLGLPEERRVRTVSDSLPAVSAGAQDETRAVTLALENNPELKRLEQEVQAKEARVEAERAQRWPQMELVAQYAVLSRFNNYDRFFRSFQRHNFELGLAMRLPVFNGTRVSARVGQAEADLTQARQTLENARRNTALEVRRLFQRVRQSEASREVARLELELARENTSVSLARYQEGRVSARELEQARLDESARWNGLLEAGFDVDRARLELLKTTGEIARVLR